MLALLYHGEQPPHYGLVIGQRLGLGNGTLYPILEKLEAAELIAGEWENIDPHIVGRRPRRCHTLSAKGVRLFEQARQQVFGAAPGVTHCAP